MTAPRKYAVFQRSGRSVETRYCLHATEIKMILKNKYFTKIKAKQDSDSM